jgi:DNA excision repair protein ERCC-3
MTVVEELPKAKPISPIEEQRKTLEAMQAEIGTKLAKLAEIEASMQEQERNIQYAAEVVNDKLGNIIEKDRFMQFFKKPYVTWAQARNKVLVFVPKFVKGFEVGWLLKEDETFDIYQLDQYSAWLGDVPKDLLDAINFKQEVAGTIEGDTLHYETGQKEAIKKKLGHHLADISENQARIVRGHAFDIIADMVESGCLPFKPRKVSQEDMRAPKSSIQLRGYQKPAIKKFLETGAVGVFYPTGAGKSFISLYAIDIIKGKKLLIVPTRTLAEQWEYYIEQNVPHAKDEVKIVTYQGFREANEEYALTIYDECQRLPADTFSRLSVIPTKYRIGLSASPHREDGRESYIFALTGFPVGLNWKDYMQATGRTYHPIYVHIVRSATGKLNKLRELIDTSKKTFIFCDTIELGKQVAKEYDIPYIYGQTSNRLQEIEDHKVVAVSRVADLGVSVKDLQRIIEVDFLFGSRQQELQRTGRLMHSEAKNLRHDIIMTEAEKEQYGKRLWALQEKGFTIKVLE